MTRARVQIWEDQVTFAYGHDNVQAIIDSNPDNSKICHIVEALLPLVFTTVVLLACTFAQSPRG